jgi:tRNA(Ile2) C34 agmatinyltransferase TiaS
VSKYPGAFFELESKLFPRTAGEMGVDGVSDADFKARQSQLSTEEQNDYIQEGLYGKALAVYMESALKKAGFTVTDNYAEDHGRHVVVQSSDAKKVHLVCASYDPPDATEDGTSYMISVTAYPSFKAKFLQDNSLVDFTKSVVSEVERILSTDPGITMIEKS